MRKIFASNAVKDFLNEADDKTRKKIGFVLMYLADDKNPLTEPYVKHVSIRKYNDLYELRAKALGIWQGFYLRFLTVILYFSTDFSSTTKRIIYEHSRRHIRT